MEKQKDISPFPQENVFKTPENYFEGLEQNILFKAGISMENTKSENNFHTPENYFETLSVNILKNAQSPKNRQGFYKKNSIVLGTFVLLVVVLLTLFLINDNSEKATLAGLSLFAEKKMDQLPIVPESDDFIKETLNQDSLQMNTEPVRQYEEISFTKKQKIVDQEENQQIVIEQKNHFEELDDTLIKEYIETIDISAEEWFEIYELESPDSEIDFIESEIDDATLLEELNNEENIEEYLWLEQF